MSFDDVMRVLAGVLPALLGTWGAHAEPAASSDPATIRVVGLGFTGIFRGLDALLAAPMMVLPLGTQAFRAALASAVLTGVAGFVAFDLARSFAQVVTRRAWGDRLEGVEGRSGRLLAVVSACAVLTALLGPAWQHEASTVGGGASGALMVIVALRLAVSPEPSSASLRGGALLLGLAVSQEPLVLLLVLIAALAAAAAQPRIRGLVRGVTRAEVGPLSGLFLVGLFPLAVSLMLARRSTLLALPVSMTHGAFGDGAPALSSLGAVKAFFLGELGSVVSVLALLGAGAAVVLRARRAVVVPIVVVALASLAACAVARSTGGNVSSPMLVAILLLHAMAAAALAAVVLFVANTRVPFAEASAAMVVLLELALPAHAADETATRRDARHPLAASSWTDMAFASAPVASVLLVAEPSLYQRIVAARATWSMRPDVLVLPTFAVRSPAGLSALAREPKLTALVRDLALGASPEELSFAELASVRPVLATFDPRWDRALARHLVPLGLTSRFELEPRGISDRRAALDAFRPIKERLVQTITGASPDVTLTALTAAALRSRAVAMAACGEREVLSRALDDLRPFAPEDPVANTLVRRIVTTRGAIEVKDLAP